MHQRLRVEYLLWSLSDSEMRDVMEASGPCGVSLWSLNGKAQELLMHSVRTPHLQDRK